MRSNHIGFLAIAIAATLVTFLTLYSKDSQSSLSIPSEVRTLYKNWKAKHLFSFDLKEDESRLKIFYNNYKFVQAHNALPNKTYTVGLNKFAALSFEEFLRNFTFI